ncbi:glucose-6-phosphate isomerase [Moritella sp. Urea-trap-13]|uniref:glucose-6-phosphate isomerase n=1 Tax=Moritella sp. Urea-trap-13 TaxID=2058327 RepID=UPI000C33CEA0|nr:glucose-6-phosphate isomerase [Moritella sp. Urea-trap-13]PKH05153.1 glucose-6-phosphate isomerase [Moritella sp. Urea-trap-13]
MIKQHWLTMNDKFKQLSMRERVLLVGSLACAIIYIIFSFVLEPNYARNKQLATQLSSLTQQQRQYNFTIAELQQVLVTDPNKVIKLRISRAENELKQANGKLTDLTADLINSNQMALVLGDVLSRAKKVKLLAIESLPVTAITGNSHNTAEQEKAQDKSQAKPKMANASGQEVNSEELIKADAISSNINSVLESSGSEVLLYRHGLRITMTGAFFDIQAYLDSIEQLPKKFYWEVFDYQMQTYPTAEVVMEIYTLSINKEFIRG